MLSPWSRLGPHSWISGHGLCPWRLWGSRMEQKPCKGTCFASFHRCPILFCLFKLLLLCALQYPLPLQMVSQQREPSPLIPSPGNSRSLCRELVQKQSGMVFNTWTDLSVDSCPHKCPIICHTFCRSGSEVSSLTLQPRASLAITQCFDLRTC